MQSLRLEGRYLCLFESVMEIEVRQLKLSLDKALDTETDAGKVLDILKAISKIDITIDLLSKCP